MYFNYFMCIQVNIIRFQIIGCFGANWHEEIERKRNFILISSFNRNIAKYNRKVMIVGWNHLNFPNQIERMRFAKLESKINVKNFHLWLKRCEIFFYIFHIYFHSFYKQAFIAFNESVYDLELMISFDQFHWEISLSIENGFWSKWSNEIFLAS